MAEKKIKRIINRGDTTIEYTRWVQKTGSIPKECDLVGSADFDKPNAIHFFSVKAAKRALAGLIAMLPERKKGEPKRFVIENKK